MNQKTNFVIILIAIVFIAYMFLEFFMAPFTGPAHNEVADGASSALVVPVTKTYDGTTYAIHGVLELPTPCHSLSTGIRIERGDPEIVHLVFASDAGDAVCAQVVTPREFSVSFDAGADARIDAALNGVRLELLPVAQ